MYLVSVKVFYLRLCKLTFVIVNIDIRGLTFLVDIVFIMLDILFSSSLRLNWFSVLFFLNIMASKWLMIFWLPNNDKQEEGNKQKVQQSRQAERGRLQALDSISSFILIESCHAVQCAWSYKAKAWL